jgi:hypothetical protein
MGLTAALGRACLLACLAAAAPPAPAAEPAILDNSFLVEEAYNQEDHVVQHISSFALYRESRDWVGNFTQEWPLFGAKHQLSYTLAWLDPGEEAPGGAGAGDLALNYRWQAAGGSGEALAFAWRVSVLLPTGDDEKGRGSGSTGFQLNLPLSLRISPGLAAHSNAGIQHFSSERNDAGDEAGTTGYNLGQSLIWLLRPDFNLMLEAAWTSFEEVTGPGRTSRSSTFLLSPGARWALNLPSGTQIVPGVALPVGVGPSSGDYGLFLYLSFEHPFGAGSAER